MAMDKVDVCVIGAGPAGISLAIRVAAAGKSVALLESGGREITLEAQALNCGEIIGGLLNESIEQNRTRLFGGTSVQWTGFCAPIDPEEFEAHPEIPLSGWPIGYADLEPFYEQSKAILDLPDENFSDPPPDAALADTDWAAHGLEWRNFKKSPPTRFLVKYFAEVSANPGIALHLEATFQRANMRNGRIESVVFDQDGEEKVLEARRFVLATGGIEATRNLLVMREQFREELGDPLRSVGQFFATHPHFSNIRALLLDELAESPLLDPATDGGRPVALQIPAKLRQENALDPMLLRFELPMKPEGAKGYEDELLRHLRQRPNRFYRGPLIQAGVRAMRESTITLAKKKDRFGIPGTRVELKVHPDSWRSMDETLHLMIKGLGSSDKGRIRFSDNFFNDAKASQKGFTGGHHHLCSTRMASSPADGVVDRDLKVFGLENLYVCSASSFATTGSANPTMTLVALALRLGEALAEL